MILHINVQAILHGLLFGFLVFFFLNLVEIQQSVHQWQFFVEMLMWLDTMFPYVHVHSKTNVALFIITECT